MSERSEQQRDALVAAMLLEDAHIDRGVEILRERGFRSIRRSDVGRVYDAWFRCNCPGRGPDPAIVCGIHGNDWIPVGAKPTAIRAVQVNATLATCPECDATMVLQNGVIVSRVTFWQRDGVLSMVTPHTDGCALEGKPLDRNEDTKRPNEEPQVGGPGFGTGGSQRTHTAASDHAVNDGVS